MNQDIFNVLPPAFYRSLENSEEPKLPVFKAVFHDVVFLNTNTNEEELENFRKVLKSEDLYAMAKSPVYSDGRPVLVDLVTENHRISHLLLEGCMKNLAKPLEVVFNDLSSPNLNDKRMELGFLQTLSM